MFKTKSNGSVVFVIVTLIGLLVAGGTFFAVFITSQKAKSPSPYQNLKLIVPSLPPKPTLPPMPGSSDEPKTTPEVSPVNTLDLQDATDSGTALPPQ